MEDSKVPVTGEIVRILRGRDAGKHAVVIRQEDDRFVYIADGDKRKYDQPKKKNILHLGGTGIISPEVVNSIRETGRVTNGKLRFALQQFDRREPDAP